MFGQVWWQPFFSPGIASVVTITTQESWAVPVGVTRPQHSSGYSLVHGIPDLVELGHKA